MKSRLMPRLRRRRKLSENQPIVVTAITACLGGDGSVDPFEPNA
jgi:hypothetical protein